MNLTLRRGTVTAMVGRSGAGKSTVAALLSRFYLPQHGQILLDGKDANTFTRGEWARAIAMVSQVRGGRGVVDGSFGCGCSCSCPSLTLQPPFHPTSPHYLHPLPPIPQEPVLFSGTIADNIAYGKFGKCGQAEIQAAAEAANAHEFIMGLPEGYKTVVGERGTLLSGGGGCVLCEWVGTWLQPQLL